LSTPLSSSGTSVCQGNRVLGNTAMDISVFKKIIILTTDFFKDEFFYQLFMFHKMVVMVRNNNS